MRYNTSHVHPNQKLSTKAGQLQFAEVDCNQAATSGLASTKKPRVRAVHVVVAPTGFELSASGPGRSLAIPQGLIL